MDFVRHLRRFISETSIGASALRNQGHKDVVQIARDYMKNMGLSSFCVNNEEDFLSILNRKTNRLKNKFLGDAHGNWGAARKAINLFLRDSLYNKYLNEQYNLDTIGEFLEVPLDGFTSKGIRKICKCSGIELNLNSNKFTIRGLNIIESTEYQKAAKKIAEIYECNRVDLDILFWRNV